MKTLMPLDQLRKSIEAARVQTLMALQRRPDALGMQPECIIGWELDKQTFHSISSAQVPDGYIAVVGAYSEEWHVKKCDNTHFYLIPRDLLRTKLEDRCWEQELLVFQRDKRILQWLAGFSPIEEERAGEFGPIERHSEADSARETDSGDEGQPPVIGLQSYEVRPFASIFNAYQMYVSRCDCGDRYDDNCAHFLTNAMIKAGYNFSSYSAEKCSCGRLIRAKECLTWIQQRRKRFRSGHSRIAGGYWIVYQERSDGQGHVCFHKEEGSSYTARGTGDFPSWPVQWHYLL